MKKRTKEILAILDDQFGVDHVCYLDYETPWQLLIATILSAQCTDARVNIVTKDLFRKYPTVISFAQADLKELEKDIKSTGFYHNKAKNIIACMTAIEDRFGGEVPRSIEDLTSLAGVGRKTANVIRGNIYQDPSVVVDTHVKRISKRLGFTKSENPEKIEQDLMRELPKEHWIRYNIQIIAFGRSICTARSPKCDRCRLQEYCVEYSIDLLAREIRPGDEIILCGYLALEGMFLIWQEQKEELKQHFSHSFCKQVEQLKLLQIPSETTMKSIADIAREKISLTGIQAIGKGGIWAALWELSEKAQWGIEIELAQMPLKQETIEICEYYRLNPYRLTSTGCFLLVTVEGNALLRELEKAGIRGSKLGIVTEEKKKRVKGKEEIRYIGHRNQEELERWRFERGVCEDAKCSVI